MLETSDFLKDDCLKINCTVGVVVSAIDCPRLHSIQVPESDIGVDFAMLLENEEGSDVTFNVSGEKFCAHKLILAARSPVFEAELLDLMDKENLEVVISDMEPKVFKVCSSHGLMPSNISTVNSGLYLSLTLDFLSRPYFISYIKIISVRTRSNHCLVLLSRCLYQRLWWQSYLLQQTDTAYPD